ncbi:MAG: M16 family metallopeptidase [Candidatus Eisenbacteria bacterium]
MTQGTYRKTVLPSGLTVLTERMSERRSIAFGLFVRNGARDEPLEQLGISHFLEHMMFKGTARRDARAIALSLESLGGHLDAFTAREQVCYYARVLGEHLPQVVDVVADIVCHSRFDDRDLEREKSVVREEILAYEDNPEEKVNDVLAAQSWGAHPLGRPILGTGETVDAFTREQLVAYHARRYRADQMVVAATGGLEHEHVVELAAGTLEPPLGAPMPLSEPPQPVAPRVAHEVQDVQQLYIGLASRGVPDGHPDRYPLVVLNALFGGGMSSRLFQSVREEAGLAYSVYSALEFYRDAGALLIHMGVSPERGREALARTHQELTRIAAEGPEVEEIEAARGQIRGSILLDHESVSSRMFHLAGEEILRGTFTGSEDLVTRIEAVTDDQVRDVARRYLDPARWTLAALGPAPGGPLGPADWQK